MKKESMEKSEIKEEGMKKEEKEISTAEKGELPPVFMIYRDNDLFKEWIPKIAETLKGLGRKVEIQSFPAGTREKEVREWLEKHQKDFKGKEIVTDRTASPVDLERYKDGVGYYPFEPAKVQNVYLDSLFEYATERVIMGERPGDEAYTNITKRILENEKNRPKRVIILTDRIFDHYSEQHGFEKILDKRDPRDASSKQKIAAGNLVKEWLIKGGVPEDIIEIGDLNNTVGQIYQQGNWIVVDRHCGIERPLENGTLLRLPLGNFYRDAQEQSLVEAKPEELKEAINKLLKEDFGQKPESEEDK